MILLAFDRRFLAVSIYTFFNKGVFINVCRDYLTLSTPSATIGERMQAACVTEAKLSELRDNVQTAWVKEASATMGERMEAACVMDGQ